MRKQTPILSEAVFHSQTLRVLTYAFQIYDLRDIRNHARKLRTLECQCGGSDRFDLCSVVVEAGRRRFHPSCVQELLRN